MTANPNAALNVEDHVDAASPPSSLESTVVVAAWELRRIIASRLNLVVAFGAFCFFVGLIGIKHVWLVPVETGAGRGVVLTVYGSTALGADFEIVGILLLFFGMLLPFLSASAVSHDYQDRIHELVMATPMPTIPYVLGRYLAATVTCLVAACLLLLAIVASNTMLHASDPAVPTQNVPAVLETWLIVVVPAVVFVAGVSFFLGTALPRLATPIKVAVVLVWAMLSVIVDIGHGLGWFGYWTPTGSGVLKVIPQQVANLHAAEIRAGVPANTAAHVQDLMPNLLPWLGPHLGLVGLGLAAGLLAALGFRRFRGVME